MEEIRKKIGENAGANSFGISALWVYNPLTYAWRAFEEYVVRYGGSRGEIKKRVLFLGMNPGPWGMAQTGVPFGEVAAVRDWLGISAPVEHPPGEHPKYPIDGFACKRSEVSGKRLWGLFKRRFGSAESFFAEHFVINYCPLLFIDTPGSASSSSSFRARNLTPDKLPASLRAPIYQACDAHLRALVLLFRAALFQSSSSSPPNPEFFVIGVGGFAAGRAEIALSGLDVRVGKILHPSPASPQSNLDWAGTAARQLIELGVWKEA
jgi:single-strand selective monofunctional uracil DNA glycosylase